jgi:hypothetical protein
MLQRPWVRAWVLCGARSLAPWKWVFEGCDLYRDTGAALKNAGFSKVDLRRLILATMFVPIRHQITAVCVN